MTQGFWRQTADNKLTGGAGIRCSDYDIVSPSYEARERRRLAAEARAEAERLGATTQTRRGAESSPTGRVS